MKKFTTLIIAFIVLMGAFVACKRENTDVVPQTSGVVVFPDAMVTVDVGQGWQRIDVSPGLPVCPPTLVGPAGMVRAMLFAPSVSGIQTATNVLRKMFDGNSDAVKSSFHQEEFRTDSGLRGQYVSYAVRTEKDGNTTETRSHSFVIERQDGRCVAISYIAPAKMDSDAVCQMIQKSLKLH